MKPSRTSKAWMREHLNDPYVKQAKAQGFRSRAAFKLEEINERDHLIRPGTLLVDLGARQAAGRNWRSAMERR
jgi:23S rRNA Um-2552 2''-O-methyltransferase (EC 2.1.1.-)